MLFTVTVDLAEFGHFQFSTPSLFQLAEIAQMLGSTEVEDDVVVPEEIAQHFEEGVEYVYDEDAECFCWYDSEYDVWYWLDEETGDWLLVEDEESEDEESEEEEIEESQED